jgi:glyoxylase-like metal-dependent hydrolase (beta-lactamase superfamily II)
MRTTLAVAFVLTSTAAVAHAQGADSAPAYEVYAVRFATVVGYPTRSLVVGADSALRSDLAMTVWLVRNRALGRTVLVDAGFYRDKFLTRWKPATYVKPTEALTALGVRPEDVTDIVVSHVHWDHLDGADLFPRARVWIQRAEMEHYTNDTGAVLDRAIDADDAKMLATLARARRVQLVDGDSTQIIPGITVFTGGKHTFASQYVAVRALLAGSRIGTVILASDNAYLYQNLERSRPIAQTLDSVSNLKAQARMLTMATERRLVVPGHDGEVFVRFPKPGNGIARIE